MDSRILNDHPDAGVTEWLHYDETTDTITLELVQALDVDVSNAAEYNSHSDYGPSRWKGDVHKVGSIPMVEMVRLQREGAMDADGFVLDDKAMLKVLNDRDYLKFRTMPGRL